MRVPHVWIAALLLVGCGDPEESLPPGAVAVAPPTLDFGPVPLEQSASLIFTLTHQGGGDVDVLSVSVVDGDTSLWRIDRSGVQTLSGGASGDVSVTFTPDDLGAVSGRIQIRTSSEETPSLFVDLLATGTESETDEDQDGFSPADGDCDDDDADVHPGANERCNGRDDDCDDDIPADEADDDGDDARVCDGDCDDADGYVYPGAAEVCDGKDTDCEGGAHDDDDLDGDGQTVCGGDCDDGQDTVFLGAPETCDGLDNDCSGVPDDLDTDQDGHSLCSVAGDCDDDDPDAHPVLVTAYGSSSGDGTPAAPFDSLATALANLDDVCRTVWVEPGAWELEGTWSSGALTILGGGAGPADTQIVPVGYQRLLTVGAGGDVTFENVTLTGGIASGDGGAVNVGNGGALTLRDVVAVGNQSDTDGGAVAVSSGVLVLEGDCVFEGNVAMDDGGAVSASSSTFIDRAGTRYVGNSGSQGGAIYASGGAVELVGAELRANVAADEGGAIALSGAGSYALERNLVVLNTASAAGGGLALRDVDDPDGVVRNNRVQDNTAGGVGGGIALTGGSAAITVANNTLVANTSAGEGAGIHVAPTSADELTVAANVSAFNNGASGVFVSPASTAVVQYNTGYLTNSNVEFAGAVSAGTLDNESRDPDLVAVTPDDGNPDNDDLDLLPGSPEIDSGPPFATFDDPDGSVNDRGHTGGPGALP